MKVMKTVLMLAALLMASLVLPVSAHDEADSLYIGDGGDDSVKRFNAKTGEYLGVFVSPGSGGLLGPRGLIFTRGKLHVANQNVGLDFAGEILRYSRKTGDFLDALVPCNPPLGRDCDPNAPFAPRGLIRGPDGLIYVSVTGDLSAGDVLTGYVLRFNPHTGNFVDVFTSNLADGCAVHLHRPEGLVFGPDEKLYVTRFRADRSDTDKILIFDEDGQCLDQIDLYNVQLDEPRAFAQALLFGPKKRLFVPINNTGEVRRYNVKTKAFNVFVSSAASGGPLQQPWYLTFGETDPRTLEYDD